MRMLTGADRLGSFSFAPLLLCTIDDKVFVEGHDTSSKVCWVHVWTVVGGVVTELREYFNTSVTVTGIDSSTFTTKTSQKAPKIADSEEFSTLWESELSRRSIPGFILAI
ncbi:hypothetical protein O6H91_07G036700 [Diphasiastrum complanatum]|nr:hypothetical protein O6H91_07G036700 [Diphasiastrum complanatum]